MLAYIYQEERHARALFSELEILVFAEALALHYDAVTHCMRTRL